MTLWDMLRALGRRWPVVLVGLAVTALTGLLAVREPGVYFTRMQVVFLAPSTWYRNVLQTTPDSVIVTASAVAKRIVGAGEVIKYGSLEATIIGTTGARDGVWLRAEDQGGQWAPDIRTSIIVVDVVASTAAGVRDLQNETVELIRVELDRLQGALDNSHRDLITIEVAPTSTVIYLVRGDRIRALAMTGILGTAVILVVVAAMESRDKRRRSLSAAAQSKQDAQRELVSEDA